MKKLLLICLLTVNFGTAAYCGQISEIKLTDGTVMRGEIVSLDGHICVVRTADLGDMQIEASKIKNIRMDTQRASDRDIRAEETYDELGPADINAEVQRIQNMMMANPKAEQMLTELAATPDIQKLAADPQIVAAVQSGNIQTLLSNKKFMDVAQDPKIQELNAEVTEE